MVATADITTVYTEYMALDKLVPHAGNPKAHDVEAIKASIRRFGFTNPLVLDERTGILAAGHGRLIALAEMRESGEEPPLRISTGEGGDWLVPVMRGIAFNSDAERDAYLIADNRLTELGGWDDRSLADMLTMIQTTSAELLAVTGFSEFDLKTMIEELTPLPPPTKSSGGSDPAETLQKEWMVQPGELWIIPSLSGPGVHRLLCGDAGNYTDMTRLMADELADCMWTDPPYGVSYTGKTADALDMENDDSEGLVELLTDSFRVADGALKDGAAIYIAHPPGALGVTFANAFLEREWRLHETLIWVKDSMVLGHSDYHFRHEPILFGYKPGGGRRGRGGAGWYGDDSQTSVLQFDRPKSSQEHPTMKPVELVAYCLGNSAPRGGIVYDPFVGSGTTLAAAEQKGMQGRALELEPKYCAVTLQRLKEMGLEPERGV